MEKAQCNAKLKEGHLQFATWTPWSHSSMGLCNGSDADHAFDDDNLRSEHFWRFNQFSRVDIEPGEIPGFTRLALDVQ
jgi:hypothetical protein